MLNWPKQHKMQLYYAFETTIADMLFDKLKKDGCKYFS